MSFCQINLLGQEGSLGTVARVPLPSYVPAWVTKGCSMTWPMLGIDSIMNGLLTRH